jgi:hypothetical protein
VVQTLYSVHTQLHLLAVAAAVRPMEILRQQAVVLVAVLVASQPFLAVQELLVRVMLVVLVILLVKVALQIILAVEVVVLRLLVQIALVELSQVLVEQERHRQFLEHQLLTQLAVLVVYTILPTEMVLQEQQVQVMVVRALMQQLRQEQLVEQVAQAL